MNTSSILSNFPGFANARVPQDLFVFFDDFLGSKISSTTDLQLWDWTDITSTAAVVIANGTDEARDEAGGFLQVTPVASSGDGANLQVNGEAFHFSTGQALFFETRVNFQDTSNMEVFIGLSVTDATIFGGVTDRFGFELSGDVLSVVSEKDSNQKTVDTLITETNNDWIRLAFFWDGVSTVKAYVDTNDNGDWDEEVYTFKTSVTGDYIPDNMMLTPSIEHITGAADEADVLWVDYVYCAQTRYHE